MKGYRACTRRMAEIADVFFNDEPEEADDLGREYHDCVDFQRAVEVEVSVGYLRSVERHCR